MKKSFVVSLVLCLMYSLGFSQKNPIQYGISLGFNLQKPIIIESGWEKEGLDELKDLNISSGYGFQLGITGFYKMSENFGLRLNPSVDFTESSIEFTEVLDKKTKYLLENVGIQIPLKLEWIGSSWKFNPSISMGASYFKNFVSTEKETPFALKHDDIAAQIALGIKMNFTYFNVHPQLVYTSGLNNLEQLNSSTHTRAIQSWRNQMLTLQVIFEK